MTLSEIKSLLETKLPGAVVGEDLICFPAALRIHPDLILDTCELLHSHPSLYFDQLACLTGIDNGPEVNIMEVIYALNSLPKSHRLTLKVELPRDKPEIESVSSIWRTANWHEREAFDLLGIHFKNHPDLRRILMPTDWVGHPLRKDYQEQETYHGVVVKYDRKEIEN